MIDLLVIGGGASGLCAAIQVKRNAPYAEVLILEKNDRVGKKLAVTGNGRCNIINRNALPRSYHGDVAFVGEILKQNDISKVEDFLKSVGIMVHFEDGGKGYPLSNQATSVVDALRFAAEDCGVLTVTGAEVTAIHKLSDGFSVSADNEYKSRNVLIATGGVASKGSDSGYKILKSLGHKVFPVFPSIVQVKTETNIVRQLKGIKINAMCSAVSGGKILRSEYGEVLFCDYGLSGPPILQLSRLANEYDNIFIKLDLMHDMCSNSLYSLLYDRKELYKNREMSEFFTGIIHKKLGQVIIKSADISLNSTANELSGDDIERIAEILKGFTFKSTGTRDLNSAQVTAGGADTSQFFTTLESKKAKGLFATGEVLNIDGDCGGFNLTFAFSSALCAAAKIEKNLEK